MQDSNSKTIALEFLKWAGQGRFKEGLKFFSHDCKTHNPYIAGGMDALTDAMVKADEQGKAQYPKAEFSVKHALANGDLVAVHTELLNNKANPGEGGLRQIHLFRFEGDKIVEYWDVSQQVLPSMPNAAGAFSGKEE